MAIPSQNPVTQILASIERGDASAHERLWSAIYDELHGMARGQMAKEAAGRTLQPTALVHEAYLRLFGSDGFSFANRRHFFGAAAKAMRRIRIDDARRRGRLKRGGDHQRGGGGNERRGGDRPGPMHGEPAVFDQDPAEVLAIDEALGRLEAEDARRAEVVTLRYFAGLNVAECAEALGVSDRTVENDWHYARAWLHRELSKGDSAGD